ncbi:hypothetical protein B0I37DRAFT_165627 [Chaetomium sp. MPI-CAGE-AT-0009]|nr:hypothetical protein B0I37DRAFT_165627 [Chaetomium sp. MPI-CAGE-AT-0009]
MPSLTRVGLVVLASSHSIHASSPAQLEPTQAATRIHARAINGTGVMYLVDCHPREPPEQAATNSTQTWMSLVISCANSTDCNNVDHFPAPRDSCVMKTSTTPRDYHKWENSDWQHCYFAERGVFSWAISRFGRLFPPATEVGIGEDADSREFAGFRDDESQGAGPATHNCSKVYYFA